MARTVGEKIFAVKHRGYGYSTAVFLRGEVAKVTASGQFTVNFSDGSIARFTRHEREVGATGGYYGTRWNLLTQEEWERRLYVHGPSVAAVALEPLAAAVSDALRTAATSRSGNGRELLAVAQAKEFALAEAFAAKIASLPPEPPSQANEDEEDEPEEEFA